MFYVFVISSLSVIFSLRNLFSLPTAKTGKTKFPFYFHPSNSQKANKCKHYKTRCLRESSGAIKKTPFSSPSWQPALEQGGLSPSRKTFKKTFNLVFRLFRQKRRTRLLNAFSWIWSSVCEIRNFQGTRGMVEGGKYVERLLSLQKIHEKNLLYYFASSELKLERGNFLVLFPLDHSNFSFVISMLRNNNKHSSHVRIFTLCLATFILRRPTGKSAALEEII